MPQVAVLNQAGVKVSDLELNSSVFETEYNGQVIYDVVNAQRAAMRQGTAKTKTRTEVSGGGRKPWRQKGTGRARQGSIRAPQWRGGGVAFGPTPRSYKVKVNRKVAQLALRIALSDKLANGKLIVVDKLALEGPKTKEFLQVMGNINAEGKTLIGVDDWNLNVDLASRNVPTSFVEVVNHMSVYDVLNSNTLVLTVEAVKLLEGGLANE